MAPLSPPPAPTLNAIYAAYVVEAGDGFRDHLGASIVGKECRRALWYDFRWVTRARFTGRMLRLFETGKREEERLVRDLRRTGATVLDTDPETGRQWRVSAVGGHFGGSLDAVAIGLLEAPKTWHVVEFKTHGLKSFAALKNDGVERAKPQHAAQMQIYMHLNLAEAAYASVFVTGWRPAIGWVCALALVWAFLLQPVATWAISTFALGLPVPAIVSDHLFELVLAMLGMAGLRTFEKTKRR